MTAQSYVFTFVCFYLWVYILCKEIKKAITAIAKWFDISTKNSYALCSVGILFLSLLLKKYSWKTLENKLRMLPPISIQIVLSFKHSYFDKEKSSKLTGWIMNFVQKWVFFPWQLNSWKTFHIFFGFFSVVNDFVRQ